jgi:hypothetical protein
MMSVRRWRDDEPRRALFLFRQSPQHERLRRVAWDARLQRGLAIWVWTPICVLGIQFFTDVVEGAQARYPAWKEA